MTQEQAVQLINLVTDMNNKMNISDIILLLVLFFISFLAGMKLVNM